MTGSGLPPELDPRHWRQTGAQVLDHGVPDLPAQLTSQMSIPLCSWAAETYGAVVFMLFLPDPQDGQQRPSVTLMTYTRHNGGWIAPPGNTLSSWGSNDGFNPLTDPHNRPPLDGSHMTRASSTMHESGGQHASIIEGHVSPDVKYLAVIQDGKQDYRPLRCHFGYYVVCPDKPGPFDVAAFDSHGKLLSFMSYPTQIDLHIARMAERRRASP